MIKDKRLRLKSSIQCVDANAKNNPQCANFHFPLNNNHIPLATDFVKNRIEKRQPWNAQILTSVHVHIMRLKSIRCGALALGWKINKSTQRSLVRSKTYLTEQKRIQTQSALRFPFTHTQPLSSPLATKTTQKILQHRRPACPNKHFGAGAWVLLMWITAVKSSLLLRYENVKPILGMKFSFDASRYRHFLSLCRLVMANYENNLFWDMED